MSTTLNNVLPHTRELDLPERVKLTTAYITHPICSKHEMGAWHPESPARLATIDEA